MKKRCLYCMKLTSKNGFLRITETPFELGCEFGKITIKPKPNNPRDFIGIFVSKNKLFIPLEDVDVDSGKPEELSFFVIEIDENKNKRQRNFTKKEWKQFKQGFSSIHKIEFDSFFIIAGRGRERFL